MPNNQRALAPRPPAVHPNPSSLTSTARSTKYLAPNADTLDNVPVLLIKPPQGAHEVSLADAVAETDWDDSLRIQEFFAQVKLKYDQVGNWRDYLAQQAYDLTKHIPKATEEFLKHPALVQGRKNFEDKRNRRAESRNKLLSEFARVADMKKFRERCTIAQVPVPREYQTKLPEWTSVEFFDELIIPYGGDAISLLDAYQRLRVHPYWFTTTPLKILQIASHEMICRLARIRTAQRYRAELHLIEGDLKHLTDGTASIKEEDQAKERELDAWDETIARYGFKESHGLFWTGQLPANYENLIATQGRPGPVMPLTAPLKIPAPQPPPQILDTSRQTRSQTGHLPPPQQNLAGLAGPSTPIRTRQPTRNTNRPRLPEPASTSSSSGPVLAPVPLQPWQGMSKSTVPIRSRSTGLQKGTVVQLGEWGQNRPALGSKEWVEQMKNNPVDISVVAKRERPQTVTPGPDVPPAVFSVKKPKISNLFYGIEVGQQLANWGMRVASPSGAAPPPHSLGRDTPENLPNPIPNPGSPVQFAWSMVQKYVRRTDYRLDEPLLSKDDVERYHEYGAEKMIDALSLLARHMPGRYPRAFLYMAEKGIQLHLEGLERVAAQHEDPMKSLRALTTEWEAKLGMQSYWVRPGDPDYKIIEISVNGLRTALVDQHRAGWVSESFINAGIAAGRRDTDEDCKVIPSTLFHFWIKQCRKANNTVPFSHWGDLNDIRRRIIIFNDDLEGNGNHWLFFTCDHLSQSFSIINSKAGRSESTKEAAKYLHEWLKGVFNNPNPREITLTSGYQADNISCGIWVILNVLAILRTNNPYPHILQESLYSVSVDIGARLSIAKAIYEMVRKDPKPSNQAPPSTHQPSKSLEERQTDNLADRLKNIKK